MPHPPARQEYDRRVAYDRVKALEAIKDAAAAVLNAAPQGMIEERAELSQLRNAIDRFEAIDANRPGPGFSQEEIFINTLSADVEVVRSVLIAFLLGMAKSRPATFADLKGGALDGIRQLGLDAPRTQDNERVRQLTIARAEAFFADVETGLGALQTKPDPSEVN